MALARRCAEWRSLFPAVDSYVAMERGKSQLETPLTCLNSSRGDDLHTSSGPLEKPAALIRAATKFCPDGISSFFAFGKLEAALRSHQAPVLRLVVQQEVTNWDSEGPGRGLPLKALVLRRTEQPALRLLQSKLDPQAVSN